MTKTLIYSTIQHRYIKLFAAILVPPFLTLCGWPFRALLTPSNILLIYLLGVYFVAIRFGLWSSILAALSSAATFSYFFAPPIFSFEIADQENLVGLVVMLVVGVVSSKQAETVRSQALIASYRERRIAVLYQLSKELSETRSEKEIIQVGVRSIYAEFGVRNTFLLPNAQSTLAYPVELPLDISYQMADLHTANRIYHDALTESRTISDFLLNGTFYLPLTAAMGNIGVLVIEALNYAGIDQSTQYQLLESFLKEIIHSLEKIYLAEQAKNATLKMQSEKLRNSLLSSISHDLRTPLATIIGAASSLETDIEHLNTDIAQSLIRVINEEAQRMSDLTIKILEMARLEAGEVSLNKQWYEAEEIIGSALRSLDKKLKHRPINLQIAQGQTLLYVDAVLLQQVIVNLLDNANKYSPAHLPIDIAVETRSDALSISISDYGSGIPIPMQSKVFDKFFQLHTEAAQSGVGLGLSICRAIVEAHKGEIVIHNGDQLGCEFKLILPLKDCPPLIMPEEQWITVCKP